MKITKTQLKHIINEEISKALGENETADMFKAAGVVDPSDRREKIGELNIILGYLEAAAGTEDRKSLIAKVEAELEALKST